MNHSYSWSFRGVGLSQNRTRNARVCKHKDLFCCWVLEFSHLLSVQFLLKTIKRFIYWSTRNVLQENILTGTPLHFRTHYTYMLFNLRVSNVHSNFFTNSGGNPQGEDLNFRTDISLDVAL